MATPWYMYPLDSPGGGYGEGIDPVCGGGAYCHYLKPDTNIAVPPGTPITSVDSGYITDVSNRGAGNGGLSVTMKLDHPPNGSAQYASYNFLGNSSVTNGQRVSPGQTIGFAGSPLGILFAFALGNSPSWGSGSFPQGNGDPRFDPRIVLNPLRSGKGLPVGASATLSPQEQAKLNAQNSYSSLPFGIGGAITSLQQSFVNFTEEVAVFTIALLLIVMGIMILAGKQIGGFVEGSAKKGVEVAAL